MRSLLLLPIFLPTLLSAQGTCSTAMPVLPGSVYTVDTIDGNPVVMACPPTAYPGSHAVWYAYTAAQDTGLIISTDLPQNAGGDTRVFVYTGTCASLSCAGNDDDGGSGDLAVASLNVTAGTTYLIAFDNYWSGNGFDFQLQETVPDPNTLAFTAVNLAVQAGWASCVVDMNGDHLDDVVGTTQSSISVNYQQEEGGFVNALIQTEWAQNDAGWSICAGDLDHNGYNDLMYGGGSGTTFMFANADGTGYTAMNRPEYIFCQRTNMVDINNDGHLDAFSCHDVAANVYYLNDGNGNYMWHQGGLGENCGNYGSIWTDIDNDHDMDLFVAKCGCDPLDILYRNNGDGSFSSEAGSLGFADYQQSWSSAWGDFDNDGDMDAMVGTSAGDFQKLMRNDGGTFTNVTPGSGFDAFFGSTIEWVTHDFDNDGNLDVLGGGSLMRGHGDLTFTQVNIDPQNGPVGDLNNDGFLDIVNWSVAYMNTGNTNHWLKVVTIGTTSNANGIGARVEVTTASGTRIREVRSGDGFGYMSSLNSYFGLGQDTEVEQVTVYWPSGLVNTVYGPAIDGTLELVEGVSTSVAGPAAGNTLTLFPDPVDGVLNVVASMPGTLPVRVHDISGKCVLSASAPGGRLDVSGLVPGLYVLAIATPEGMVQRSFTKR